MPKTDTVRFLSHDTLMPFRSVGERGRSNEYTISNIDVVEKAEESTQHACMEEGRKVEDLLMYYSKRQDVFFPSGYEAGRGSPNVLMRRDAVQSISQQWANSVISMGRTQ